MVLGSDYPHVIGDMAKSISNIEEMDIPAEDKAKIFGENGKKILKLQAWCFISSVFFPEDRSALFRNAEGRINGRERRAR